MNMNEYDRAGVYHRDGRASMVIMRVDRNTEKVISASYARALARDLLQAANEADAHNLTMVAPRKEGT